MNGGRNPATIRPMEENEREQARQRLQKQREFQMHVVVYAIVNLAVWAIWASTGQGYPWPAWLTGLWGIGLILNGWEVYFRRPITEADVDREVDRLRPTH